MQKSAKNHSFIIVGEDFALDMLLDRTRKHNLFKVTSLLHKIVNSVLVGDADHILLDNRTRVKVGGDIVAGRAYELHAAFVGLMIWLRSDKGRKE